MRETLVIGYISGGTTQLDFTRSLGAATAYMITRALEFDDFPALVGQLPKVSGPRIAHARNDLAKHFLELGADWLFMVDDDMSFDADAIDKLLQSAHPVERPIVGGLCYAAGRDGYFPTLFVVSEKGLNRLSDWEEGSLVPVDATGAACLLIHRDVFVKIDSYGEAWPWFQETTFDNVTVGEDMTFCLRARAAGFPIYVNTAVEFGHLKTVTINTAYYRQWTEAHRFVIVASEETGDFLARALSSIGVPTDRSGKRRGLVTEELNGHQGHVLDLTGWKPEDITAAQLIDTVRAGGAYHTPMQIEEALRKYR